MDFGTNKTSIEIIKEAVLVLLTLEIFIQVLMINFIKIVGKNLKNWKLLIVSSIVQIIMMSILINIMLNVAHH